MKKAATGIITGLLAMTLALALSSCGGGDGGGSGPQTVSGAISGVAATGNAISGGLVTLKCAGGLNATTTATDADGSYRFTVDKISLPCLLQVSYTTPASGSKILHSYVSSTGISNITPLTELLLAQLAGDNPVNLFTVFGGRPSRLYTASEMNAALTALKAKLQAAGISLPDITDPLHTVLIAKTDTQSGNAHDAILDDLEAALAGKGLALDRLTLLISNDVALDDDITAALAEDVRMNRLQGTHTGFLKNSTTACSFSIDAAGSMIPSHLPVYSSQIISVPNTPVGDAMQNGHALILPTATLNANNIELHYSAFTGLKTSTMSGSTNGFTFVYEWNYLKLAASGAFNIREDFITDHAGYHAILRRVITPASAGSTSPVSGLLTPYSEPHLELEINGLSIPGNSPFAPIPTPLTCIGSTSRI